MWVSVKLTLMRTITLTMALSQPTVDSSARMEGGLSPRLLYHGRVELPAESPLYRLRRGRLAVPFGLDPEDPAVVDALNSLAEGMVLTPNYDLKAHGSRSSSGADLSSYDADMDHGDDQR